MVMGITLGGVSATEISLTVASGMPSAGTIEVQYSQDPDFAFSVSPLITDIGRSSPIYLPGMNQSATYYLRARGRNGSAVEEWSNVLGVRTSLSAAPNTSSGSVVIQPAMVVVPNPVLQWIGLSEVAGFPAYNLGYDAPVAFKSKINSGPHVIEAIMGPDPVDTVALLMSNLPEASSVVIKAGATQANVRGASPTYQSASLPFRASANLPGRPGYHGVFSLGTRILQPYWRIEITCPTLPNYTMHLEHAIFGWNRVTKNHSVDRSEQVTDLGRLERKRSGVPDRTRGLRSRSASFDISMLTEAQDWSNYADLGYKVGATDPVLVVPNSKAGAFFHDRILYGAIQMKMSNPASPRYTRSFTIASILP